MTAQKAFAGVELGGTKTIVALAHDTQIIERISLPTLSPSDTLSAAHAQLVAWNAQHGLAGIGIASFGPLQLDRAKANFGHMLPTPKPGWAGADIAGTLLAGFTCPASIDTDVNGAALAEYHWGAGQGCESLCYLTIGTGIGGGLLLNGTPVHGAMHPEIGHIRIRRQPGDAFAGACPFHGDCIEGLVAGPALAARFGKDMRDVPDDDPQWNHVAANLAELLSTLLLTTAANKILIGGGVTLKRAWLMPKVRTGVVASLAGYLPFVSDASVEHIIQLAGLGEDAGPLGAIALARSACFAA